MMFRVLTWRLISHCKNLAYDVVIQQLAHDCMEGAYSLLHASQDLQRIQAPSFQGFV